MSSPEPEALLTLPECFWLFRDEPVASINVRHAKPREESADEGDDIVGDVFALDASDEESRLLVTSLVGVVEGEISHVAETTAEDIEGDAEGLHFCTWRPVQVAEQELADPKRLHDRC